VKGLKQHTAKAWKDPISSCISCSILSTWDQGNTTQMSKSSISRISVHIPHSLFLSLSPWTVALRSSYPPAGPAFPVFKCKRWFFSPPPPGPGSFVPDLVPGSGVLYCISDGLSRRTRGAIIELNRSKGDYRSRCQSRERRRTRGRNHVSVLCMIALLRLSTTASLTFAR
jgi:hypothetical protein